MRCFVFALALLGTTVSVARAQDAIPNLKGTWSGKGKTIVFGTNPYHPGSQTGLSAERARHRGDAHRRRSRWPARLGPLVILGRQHQGALRVDDGERQQDDRRCRHGRLFSHHPRLARPHGEVLHPKQHHPGPVDRRHVPHDGSDETVRLHNTTKC